MLKIEEQVLGDGSIVLHLEGELTVEYVGELREALLERLMEQDELLVNCDRVTNIDTFGYQLLCSAHRTAVAWKKRVVWHDGSSSALRQSAGDIGFSRFENCDLCPNETCCLWS